MLTLTYLPFLIAPRRPLAQRPIVLRALSDRDCESVTDVQTVLLPGFEWKALRGPRCILELAGTPVDPPLLRHLADLLTGRWRYVIRQTHHTSAHRSILDQSRLPVSRSRTTSRLVDQLARGATLLQSSAPFRSALLRFGAAYNRLAPVDAAVDCCGCLEPLVGVTDELRLRVALAAMATVRRGKRLAFWTAYDMYAVRNKLAHGSSVPALDSTAQVRFCALASAVLQEALRLGRAPRPDIDAVLATLIGAPPDRHRGVRAF